MVQDVSALTLQFLEWVARGRRSRADLMETWRSSCPRLSIWEDAILDGLVRYESGGRIVELTASGQAALARKSAAETPVERAAE